ncbi:hypothetical protein [Streptomyces sp. Ru62]|uniref:hypothetical protein n=1 Tax=Streptomyces sp. Ru62 TaxID=2080745 RepID=UPI0021560E59|nr:hypothetical protein [Streptomyces sp. Ru62]
MIAHRAAHPTSRRDTPLCHLHEPPEGGSFRASGTVEEPAERCADWFERLLNRPVVRAEWPSAAGVYPARWELADTGEALVTSGVVPADHPPARRLRIRPDPQNRPVRPWPAGQAVRP